MTFKNVSDQSDENRLSVGSKVGLGIGITLACCVLIILIVMIMRKSGIFTREIPHVVYHERSNSYSSAREITA